MRVTLLSFVLSLSLIGVAVGIAITTPLQTSTLATVSASMLPGTFVELTNANMVNWNNGQILYAKSPDPNKPCGVSGDYLTQYMDKGWWNPITKTMGFIGASHGQCGRAEFVTYTDTNNTWSYGPWLPDVCQHSTLAGECFRHGYGHNSVDPVNGVGYYRDYASPSIYKLQGSVWSRLANLDAPQSAFEAIEWFPGMNRLIYVDRSWGIRALDPAATSWVYLANTGVANSRPGLPNVPSGLGSSWAIYDSVSGNFFFGQSQKVNRLSWNGTIHTFTPRADAPESAGTDTGDGRMTIDPVSGALILFTNTGFYTFDDVANVWTNINSALTVPLMLRSGYGVGDGMVMAPIKTYGVVLIAKYLGSESKVYLYKHDGGDALDVKLKVLGPSAIGAYDFDDVSSVRRHPIGVQPLRYTWLRNGQPDAYHGGVVGPACDTALAAQTWYPGGLGVNNANVEATPLVNPARCSFPVIENGKLKLTIPTRSWAGATGRFKEPMSGMGSSVYIGPGSPLGNVLYAQYQYRLGPTANTFYMQGNTGWKTFIFEGAGSLSAVHHMVQDYGTPGCPNGQASCPNGSLPLLTAYGSIGSDGWFQGANGCTFNYNNQHPFYADPPCFLMRSGQTYEITTRIEFRASAVNASTPASGSRVLNWPLGRFSASGFTDVYVAGGTNCVPGMYHIASVQSATQVTLDTSPSPSGAGSGCIIFYSYDTNSLFQTWVNGKLIIESQTAKYAWGPNGAGNGWHNFDLNVYITNKDETQDHPAVDIYYDNVIFATTAIPMDAGTTPPPPVNQAPTVTNITPQTVVLPANSTTFTTSVTDDGLPLGSKPTYRWTGSNLTFSAPTALTTTVTASAVGTYPITFTASDSSLSTVRVTTLTISPTPPIENNPPSVLIKTPMNGQEITPKTFTINLIGVDDTGVTWLELYINNRLIHADAVSAISYPWNTSPYKGKSVTIRGVAYDADGEMAAALATVTVRK